MSNGRKLRRIWRGAGVLGAICLLVLGITFFVQKSNNVEADASNNNLSSVMPSDMTKLSLQLVFTGAEIDSTVNSTQSFTVTDKYFIAVQAHSSNEDSGWIIATALNPSSTNPSPAWTKKYNVGHGNGTTWNSKTNRIVIVNDKTRHVFNANTGAFVENLTVGTSATGIAYDDVADKYVQTYGSSTTSGRVLDSNFNSLFTFDAGHKLVNQDVAYHKGYIYRIGWGGCSYLESNGQTEQAQYCRNNFGEGSSAIYQFDMDGNYKDAFYIASGYGELESFAFGQDGTPYLLMNGKPDSTHYSVYKVTNSAALNKMKAATYKIKFGANGGSNAPSTISESVGTCSTIPSSKPSRTHYSFLGWSTSSSATSADSKYGAGKSVCNIETTLQLYAVWKENTYTITYNANGGTGAPAAQTFQVSGGKVTLSSTKPSKTNYVFKGWSTSSSATSASYSAGGSYSFTGDVTLYAVWGDVTHTITYNANGGTGAPTAQTYTMSNNTVTISSTRPTRNYYSFLGWSTNKNATSATYEAGKSYTFTNDVTLYAVWSENTYTINFDANGGTGAPSAISYKVSTGGATIPSTKPTRNYYSFLGWSTNKNATSADANYNPGSKITTGQNITLYAVWGENSRRLSFDANGGEVDVEYIDEKVYTAIDYSSVEAHRDGFDFMGWAPEVSIAGVEAMSEDNTYNGLADSTLYALWGKSITVTFSDSYGSEDVTYESYYIEDITEEITEAIENGEQLSDELRAFASEYFQKSVNLSKMTAPTRPGYTFLGWSTSPDAAVAEYTLDYDQPISSDITLYGVWAAKPTENPVTTDNILPISGIAAGMMGLASGLYFVFKRRR